MIPKVVFGRTGLEVSRIALGGFPFGGVNKARGWDPFTPAGRKRAIETIHAALDEGINYIDTAPSYGNGNSESIIGEALEGRRNSVVLATKVGYAGLSAEAVRESIEDSLGRLRTEYVDVIQFHGGFYTDEEVEHVLSNLLPVLEKLRDEGKVRFLGFSVEEPWTAKPLIESGQFEVMQVRYNLIYQGAAWHVLDEARKLNMGVLAMRPMTSGILQHLARYLAPEWQEAHDLYDVALKYVLSDSRVHMANVGMRWTEEVKKNAHLARTFEPPIDVAKLPRLTATVYRAEDEGDAAEVR